MISSKEISQLPLSNEIFYLLLQIKTLIRVMPMVSVKVTILVPIVLIGIFLHFFLPFQGRIILDLHKNLFERHVQGRILLTPYRRACLLVISVFLLSHLSLF